LHPPHERERGRRADAIDLAPLQEDSFGTATEFLPDACEILALEREIEVGGDALREAVVGRLVAFEALRLTRQIECRGERQEDDPSGAGRDRAGAARRARAVHAAGACAGHRRAAAHAGASEVRNDRSAARMPFRLVARDVSWSSVYKRSILRTKTPMSYCRPVRRAAALSRARSSGRSSAHTILSASAAASRLGTMSAS